MTESRRTRLEAVLSSIRGRVGRPFIARIKGDRSFQAARRFEAVLRLPPDAVRREADRRLRAILVHARDTVPFYRERMKAAGFDPAVAPLPSGLRTLPALSRREIFEHRDDLVSSALRGARLVETRSGGTTSDPVVFRQDREAIAEKDGAAIALKRRMGWRAGDRTAALWGARRDAPSPSFGALRAVKAAVRDAFVGESLWLPASDMSDARLDEYAARLAAFRPRALQGYPSAVDLLARRVEARGLALPIPIVLLTAEPVLPEHRERVARAFGARVFSFYGARECGWIASESEACPRLHLNALGVHVEAEEDGRLLVTDLSNRAMPLVRYEIGDLGALDGAPCGCGDPRPVLARLEGRAVDVFTLPSGRHVLGVLYDLRGVGIDSYGILDAQLVQETIDTLEVVYVPGARFEPEHVERLRAYLDGVFGRELSLSFRATDRILPGPNGKVRWCVSRVTEASLASLASHTPPGPKKTPSR